MDYKKYLELNEEEMIESLRGILKIKSENAPKVVTKEGVVYPFGTEVQEALEYMLSLGEKLGFDVKNVDNYGGHIDWKSDETDEIVGILGHLDVVPSPGNWSHEPYAADIADGGIYARGTTDDKGPIISALYGMKALKDAGFKPKRTIRIILGLDEETEWEGMDYYFAHERKPNFGITPDAEFPIINGEKGMMVFDILKKFSKGGPKTKAGWHLRSVKGGSAPNSVPDNVRAVLRNDDPKAYDKFKDELEAFRMETGYRVTTKGVGKSIELISHGISSHGARPEDGLNAVSIMMRFFERINFAEEDINDFISFYNRHISFCLDGEYIGLGISDEQSGKLIFNVGMIDLDPEAAKLTINVRYPVTSSDTEVYSLMSPVLDKYGLGLVKGKHHKPIYIDVNSPFVTMLVDIYRKHTGDMENEPMVIGGGTYARACENIIAFGAQFPDVEDRMHSVDEFISFEKLKLMTEIYTEAILKMASEDINI